jgi:Amino acid transporters
LISAGGACESIISGMCAQYVWGLPVKPFAFCMLLLFLIINCLGVEFLGKSQIILTVGMMAVLFVLGLGGLLQLGTVGQQIPVEFNPYGWGTVASAMLGGIWLYIGIEYVCPMSEEIVQPEKNIPRAMILGVITIFICDMLFGMAVVKYVPLDEIATSGVPQLVGAEAMYGTAGVVLLAIATIFAGGSSADSHMAAVPRMLYGLARDGMLPGFIAYLHPRFRTPWVAIFLAFACLSTPLFINVDISVIMTYVSIACVAWLVSYIMVQVDLIILRKKYPKLHRPFKAPLYPLPQIIGIITCVYTIVTSGSAAIIGAGYFMIAFMLYSILWVKFKMKKKCFEAVPFEEMPHIPVKFDD